MAIHNSGMDISEIRLKNMRRLAADEGSGAALARRLNMAYPLLQNYIGKTPTKKIGDKTARRVEEVFKLPRGWMDRLEEEGIAAVQRAVGDWPFSVPWEKFNQLDLKEKARIDRFIKDTIETWEAEHAVEVRKAG